jgi:hypothetical protein
MSGSVVISGAGAQRMCVVQWMFRRREHWLELRVMWYVRDRRDGLTSWYAALNSSVLMARTVHIHPLPEPVMMGAAQVAFTVPAGPFSGRVGRGNIHWAVELVAARSGLLAREHFLVGPALVGESGGEGPVEGDASA